MGAGTPRELSMLTFLEFFATFSCALFAGAALYINVVEHPARMQLETRHAAAQWAPSYRRATWMQAPLALLALASGAGAWLAGGTLAWLSAALLIGAVVPITFALIMPTNHRLLEPGRDLNSAQTRALLERWNRLHALRTALSLLATCVFIWASLGG